MTPEQARADRADQAARRRLDEARCAWDYRQYGDTRGPHEDICIRPAGLVCSLEYDPGPAPDDIRLYEGSTLGALWGMFTPEGATQLLNAVRSGWEIAERRPT